MEIKTRNIDELYLKYALDSGRKYYLTSVLFQILAFVWIGGILSVIIWKAESYALAVAGSIVEAFFIFAASHFYRKAMSTIYGAEIFRVKVDGRKIKVIKTTAFFGRENVTLRGRAVYSDVELSYM